MGIYLIFFTVLNWYTRGVGKTSTRFTTQRMSMTDTLPKGLKIAFINARSLNSEKLDQLKIHFSNFDVVGVCETWFDETQDDGELKWTDMMLYRHDRVERCGGVAFYIKKELDRKPLQN